MNTILLIELLIEGLLLTEDEKNGRKVPAWGMPQGWKDTKIHIFWSLLFAFLEFSLN